MAYIEKMSDCCYKIKRGFVPNMRVIVLFEPIADQAG
jgi:hypothetical protein